MRKPTMQDIADALDTSRISVWKAFNSQPGVSQELIQRVYAKAEELGYKKALEAPKEPTPERVVSVIVSRPESSIFWMQIIHQLAKELAQCNINLMYTYLPSAYREGYALPTALSNGAIQGAIILNVYDVHFLEMLAKLKLPKVFLDTISTVPFAKLNADLVMLEGRTLVKTLTEHVLASGRNNLGFIGDVLYAQSNADRYSGFLDALSASNIPVNPKNSMTGSIGLDSHYEEISSFLAQLDPMPNGIVCASDYIAHFVARYLEENSFRIPQDVMLTGFDNNIEYGNIANHITTVDVDTATLGARLARKIILRMDFPAAAYELSYIMSDILYRVSTEDFS